MDTDPLKDFIDQTCDINPNYAAGATDLYKAYRRWCEEQAFTSKEIFSATRFGRQLGERFDKEHTKQGAMYHGLGISGQLVTGLDLDSDVGDEFDPTFQEVPSKFLSRRDFPANPSNPSLKAKNPSPQEQGNSAIPSPTRHSGETGHSDTPVCAGCGAAAPMGYTMPDGTIRHNNCRESTE